jgi:uncharacterized membrane protein YuzA (DUF378 family)
MRVVNIITLILVIIGGINWGGVGLLQIDLVATLFGGQGAVLSRIVYILVFISALWQIVVLMGIINRGEIGAERNAR